MCAVEYGGSRSACSFHVAWGRSLTPMTYGVNWQLFFFEKKRLSHWIRSKKKTKRCIILQLPFCSQVLAHNPAVGAANRRRSVTRVALPALFPSASGNRSNKKTQKRKKIYRTVSTSFSAAESKRRKNSHWGAERRLAHNNTGKLPSHMQERQWAANPGCVEVNLFARISALTCGIDVYRPPPPSHHPTPPTSSFFHAIRKKTQESEETNRLWNSFSFNKTGLCATYEAGCNVTFIHPLECNTRRNNCLESVYLQ